MQCSTDKTTLRYLTVSESTNIKHLFSSLSRPRLVGLVPARIYWTVTGLPGRWVVGVAAIFPDCSSPVCMKGQPGHWKLLPTLLFTILAFHVTFKMHQSDFFTASLASGCSAMRETWRHHPVLSCNAPNCSAKSFAKTNQLYRKTSSDLLWSLELLW